jgi:sugar phosphate isomerase/epimerase
MDGHRKVWAGAATALATGALLVAATGAQAQRAPSVGDGTPWGQTGIQLYDFSSYLQSPNGQVGAGEITCPAPPAAATPNCVGPPAPTTQAARLERVFAWLQSKDIRNVELYGYPGNPFPTTTAAGNAAGLAALKALGDQYGIRFPGRHGNLLQESNWDNQIADSRVLGQTHLGESGLPNNTNGYNTWDRLLATAQQLNRLGKRSVEAGLGPAYFHNHNDEFSRRYTDTGVSCPTTLVDPACKSSWEHIMDRTDARWVVAQIDIGWAVCGSAFGTPPDANAGMAYVTAMINKFQSRVISYHFKDVDAAGIRLNCGNAEQREIGKGGINFGPMMAAAKNRSKYYFMERDPVGIGGPTNFNPFTNTENSMKAMRGDPAPTLYAYPPQFPSVPAGTSAAANQQAITVTNDGDAPLTITNITVAADTLDGGTATAADFAIVSQNCFGTGNVGPLAPRKLAVADDPATPDVNEASPAVPSGTCTVNVGYKPTRTNYTSVARLQFTSNSDDSVERVLLAGKSTNDYLGTVGGDVPSMLALSIPGTGGSFGTFAPTITRTYDTSLPGIVTSTAGDATLSVVDNDPVNPGKLVNLKDNTVYALPSSLTIRGLNAAQPNPAFAAVSGTPLTLLSWVGPFNQQPITLGFRQAIGSTDVLRTGAYTKTLTLTLSTTNP